MPYLTNKTTTSNKVFIYEYLFVFPLLAVILSDSIECLPWSFILGGAIGNCIDRIMVLIPGSGYNGVIDFIDIGLNQYRWYVFNIADASITIGLIILLYQSYILKEKT